MLCHGPDHLGLRGQLQVPLPGSEVQLHEAATCRTKKQADTAACLAACRKLSAAGLITDPAAERWQEHEWPPPPTSRNGHCPQKRPAAPGVSGVPGVSGPAQLQQGLQVLKSTDRFRMAVPHGKVTSWLTAAIPMDNPCGQSLWTIPMGNPCGESLLQL